MTWEPAHWIGNKSTPFKLESPLMTRLQRTVLECCGYLLSSAVMTRRKLFGASFETLVPDFDEDKASQTKQECVKSCCCEELPVLRGLLSRTKVRTRRRCPNGPVKRSSASTKRRWMMSSSSSFPYHHSLTHTQHTHSSIITTTSL